MSLILGHFCIFGGRGDVWAGLADKKKNIFFGSLFILGY
jgi:hypothetical protein